MPNTTVPVAGEAMPRISRRGALAILVAGTMPPTAALARGPISTVETPHGKIRRLAWEISGLLDGLDPRIEYVTIRASSVGRHAVFTGFDIPLGDEEIAS